MNRNVILLLAFFVVALLGGLYYRYQANAADERGATPLMRALETPEQNMRHTLRLIKHSKDINVRDHTGQTALFYMLLHTPKDLTLFNALLDAGADVNAADRQGRTPMMLVARYNLSPELTKELLRRGATVQAKDRKGNTALLWAAQYSTPEMTKLLLRAGANPDDTTAEGLTVTELIAENEKFTEQEKEGYKNALLVLSILGFHEKQPQ